MLNEREREIETVMKALKEQHPRAPKISLPQDWETIERPPADPPETHQYNINLHGGEVKVTLAVHHHQLSDSWTATLLVVAALTGTTYVGFKDMYYATVDGASSREQAIKAVEEAAIIAGWAER